MVECLIGDSANWRLGVANSPRGGVKIEWRIGDTLSLFEIVLLEQE